jgi:hypothetical protein
MLCIRFPLSLRNVEDLLHDREIEISHQTVRYCWNRFGPMFTAELRRKPVDRMYGRKHWRRQRHQFVPPIDHVDQTQAQKVILLLRARTMLHGQNRNCRVSTKITQNPAGYGKQNSNQ